MNVEKVRNIIKENQVVLFMDGSSEDTDCSRCESVLKILENYSVNYVTFDVFEDIDSVKEITGTGAFPQLYVTGRFFGGYDEIAETVSSGEFSDMLESLGVSIKDKGNIKPIP